MEKAKDALEAVLDKLKEAVENGEHDVAETYARVAACLRDIALMHL